MAHRQNNVTTRKKIAAFALLCLTPLFAQADKQRFTDYAKVKNVTPVYKTYTHRIPEEHCWIEQVEREYPQPRHHTRHNSATGTLVGGLIGGAIGHAVGRGKDNKKIGAVVGSVIGLSIGNDISKRRQQSNHHDYSYHETRYEDVQRCEVTYHTETEERLKGYDVTYQYRGETYTTRTKKHPGKRIKIAVNIQPVDY